MGLAEPRKRINISHDPRNLQWSSAEGSYGQRLMQKHGWNSGEALGARKGLRASEAEAAKVRIAVKDDTLGLGASLRSKDIEHQRTGLDAFQGLLGRLNAKDEKELKEVEKKIEDRKLTMWTQGRWGGMIFVPGGLLIQDDPAKTRLPPEKQQSNSVTSTEEEKFEDEATKERSTKVKDKTTKRQRKEERRKSRELSRQMRAQQAASTIIGDTSTTDKGGTSSKVGSHLSTPTNTSSGTGTPTNGQEQLRNGRHILRGRHINAKRAAFSDTAMLDQIFMRKS